MNKKLNICIDITSLYQKLTGIRYYIHHLIHNLAKLDTENIYYLFGGHSWKNFRGKNNYSYPENKNFRLFINPIPSKLLPYHNLIPIEFFIGQIDLFHGTNFVLPKIKNAKKVITIHDLSFEINPEWYPPEVIKWKEYVYKSAVESDKIIAVSESTKKDIINIYGIQPEKINVIYQSAGIDIDINFSEELKTKIKQKYSLPDKYFLFTGRLEPRKNIIGLLKSFYLVKKMGIKYKLVLVGNKGWKIEETIKTINELNIQQDVIFCGYVNENELPVIYNLAQVFVFPSLYEGFGHPLIEAMMYSTPIITSNISSLPEIVGDSAILVNPSDPEQIAKSMYNLATNENLRQEYIRRGKNRLKQFSWSKTTEQTLKIYHELLSK